MGAANTIPGALLNPANYSVLPVYLGSEKPLCEGPKILPIIDLQFAQIERYFLDYTNQMKAGRMSLIQMVYLDCSNLGNGPGGLMFETSTGQRIWSKAGTQGYYPILAMDGRVTVECHAGGEATIILMNFLVPPIVWTSELFV